MTSRRRFLSYAVLFLTVPTFAQQSKPKPNIISLETLEGMFANIRAKTKWNVDGNLLWGYFFFDRSPDKLRAIAQILKKAGYRFVAIYPSENKPMYVLHVEKIEHHTPQSLYARNQEFYRLAETHGIDSYDGMDVGPTAEGNPK